MPTYAYRCSVCGVEHELKADQPPKSMPRHCGQPAKRIFAFAIKNDFQEGFNPSLGMYISNRRMLSDALKVGSDMASEETQLTHNFTMHDPEDHAAFGLSDSDVAEAREYGERLRRGEMPKGPAPSSVNPNPSAVPPGVNGGWENPSR